MLDVGCWMLDVGCWMLDVENFGHRCDYLNLKMGRFLEESKDFVRVVLGFAGLGKGILKVPQRENAKISFGFFVDLWVVGRELTSCK